MRPQRVLPPLRARVARQPSLDRLGPVKEKRILGSDVCFQRSSPACAACRWFRRALPNGVALYRPIWAMGLSAVCAVSPRALRGRGRGEGRWRVRGPLTRP